MIKKSTPTSVLLAVVLVMLLPFVFIIPGCKAQGKNAQKANGFVQIFDGKTLNGWEGDPTYW
ncbi:MAG: DUF1080 domain-containing protein, partial [Segetibacter sp.]